MSKDNGGPAFPADPNAVAGMTLRDFFAAKALQGLMASDFDRFDKKAAIVEKAVAEWAYELADAMLEARK